MTLPLRHKLSSGQLAYSFLGYAPLFRGCAAGLLSQSRASDLAATPPPTRHVHGARLSTAMT